MPECKKCGDVFPNKVEIDGRKHTLSNRSYCLICSPWGKHNTRQLIENKPVGLCSECGREYNYNRDSGHRKHVCNSCIVLKSQRKKKLYAVSQFGGKCSKCGYCKCIDALDFHHIDGKEESATYVIGRWSWERAKRELDRCILVCANCHREIHYQQHRVASITGDAPDS